MSNSYFRFKQFNVEQGRCAMKVSTDACIQGAWTPVGSAVAHILDIGTGTGLLSLMLAQRNGVASIDALELSPEAAGQAKENAKASPFANRIDVVQTDATQWKSSHLYELIICNPPFFQNALKGPDAGRNDARHSDSLDMQTLIRLSLQWLTANGAASFLWPKAEHDVFADLAQKAGIYLSEQLDIRHRVGSAVTRVVGIYSKQQSAVVFEDLTIKNEADQYTDQFRRLLSPFYLHL
jgi:tRNA1Val (adenine37-N6)-methyltransferase